MNREDLTPLEEALGYRFQRPSLLWLALSHSSYSGEAQASVAVSGTASGGSAGGYSESNAGPKTDNEQLEFLGDSVLSFVISSELVQRFPQFREGALSKLRAHLVSENHLAEIARRFGIGEHLLLGRGEEKNGGRHKATLLSDGFEAVIAALYLDGGIEPVRRLIANKILDPELERLSVHGDSWTVTDFKSALQELIQTKAHQQLSYLVVDEAGPDHHKSFTVEVRLQDASSPGNSAHVRRAVGPTKKKAEQEAARQMLADLRDSEPPAAVPESAKVGE